MPSLSLCRGGVKFFHVALETPGDDMSLLEVALEGMNAEVDEAAEERKGGAGHLGKMLLSAGPSKVILIAHVRAQRPPPLPVCT
jgi:hypothetical protein